MTTPRELVEGSVCARRDRERIRRVRKRSRVLVAIGACAVSGGIQALRPSFARGCFGPKETANAAAMGRLLGSQGLTTRDLARTWRQYACYAPPFLEEGLRHGYDH